MAWDLRPGCSCSQHRPRWSPSPGPSVCGFCVSRRRQEGLARTPSLWPCARERAMGGRRCRPVFKRQSVAKEGEVRSRPGNHNWELASDPGLHLRPRGVLTTGASRASQIQRAGGPVAGVGPWPLRTLSLEGLHGGRVSLMSLTALSIRKVRNPDPPS